MHSDHIAADVATLDPTMLAKYRRVHLFSGIGGWELACQLAGWPDDWPLWTASCPCQPFSQAGKRKGNADARHLWPATMELIDKGRPPIVVGEQVASSDGLLWLDGVFADLEGAGYTCRATDLCAAGINAPHIRQRLFWGAWLPDSAHIGRQRGGPAWGRRNGLADGCATGGIPDAIRAEHERRPITREQSGSPGSAQGQALQRKRCGNHAECSCATGGVQHAAGDGWHARRAESGGRIATSGCGKIGGLPDSQCHGLEGQQQAGAAAGAVERNGVDAGGVPDCLCQRLETVGKEQAGSGTTGTDAWSDFIIVPCGDGKARRLEPGLSPLVDGVPARMVRIRGYGNAIVPQLAAVFLHCIIQEVQGAP